MCGARTDYLTVENLIEILQSYPPKAMVVVDGYEYGEHSLHPLDVRECEVQLNVHLDEWYYGDHLAWSRKNLEESKEEGENITHTRGVKIGSWG